MPNLAPTPSLDSPKQERFVVLASDGVWEHLSDDDVIEQARSLLPAHLHSSRIPPLTPPSHVIEQVEKYRQDGKPAKAACTNLIALSAVSWRRAEGNYRDDITAIVVYLPCLPRAV